MVAGMFARCVAQLNFCDNSTSPQDTPRCGVFQLLGGQNARQCGVCWSVLHAADYLAVRVFPLVCSAHTSLQQKLDEAAVVEEARRPRLGHVLPLRRGAGGCAKWRGGSKVLKPRAEYSAARCVLSAAGSGIQRFPGYSVAWCGVGSCKMRK